MIRYLIPLMSIFLLTTPQRSLAQSCSALFSGNDPRIREATLERAFYKGIRTSIAKRFSDVRSYRDQTLRSFINVYVPGSARLEGSFLASYQPRFAEIYDRNQKLTLMHLPRVHLEVLRDSKLSPPEQLPLGTSHATYIDDSIERLNEPFSIRSGHYSISGKRRTLESLYDSFANQGPERKILVDIVKKQDDQESDRTTHFLITNGTSPIAHAQILVSRHAEEPLHIESQWGRDAKPIGGKRGELGRLYFAQMHAIDEAGTIPVKSWRELEGAGLQVRLMLFQKMMSWANYDAGLESLSLQINSPVLRVLRQMGLPMHLATHQEVRQVLDGKEIKEHLFTFDQAGMRAAEQVLLQKLIEDRLQAFLNQSEEAAQKTILRFSRNEFDALLRSGLFGDETRRLLFFQQLGTLQPPQKPQHVTILSADFLARERLADGTFAEHVMAPGQSSVDSQLSFLPIASLVKSESNWAKGIFSWPRDAGSIGQAGFVELHFSRAAAREALRLFSSKPR